MGRPFRPAQPVKCIDCDKEDNLYLCDDGHTRCLKHAKDYDRFHDPKYYSTRVWKSQGPGPKQYFDEGEFLDSATVSQLRAQREKEFGGQSDK